MFIAKNQFLGKTDMCDYCIYGDKLKKQIIAELKQIDFISQSIVFDSREILKFLNELNDQSDQIV